MLDATLLTSRVGVDPPFRGVYRKAASDQTLGDKSIKAGQRVFVDLHAASFDVRGLSVISALQGGSSTICRRMSLPIRNRSPSTVINSDATCWEMDVLGTPIPYISLHIMTTTSAVFWAPS